jgi:hypothetical protein
VEALTLSLISSGSLVRIQRTALCGSFSGKTLGCDPRIARFNSGTTVHVLKEAEIAYKNKVDAQAASKRHYEANKELYRLRAKASRQDVRERLREFKDVPCMDCGVKYPPYVMDLDHRPGEVKTCNPAKLPSFCSVKKFEQEIAKCDVVCSNCHRQRTFDRKEA